MSKKTFSHLFAISLFCCLGFFYFSTRAAAAPITYFNSYLQHARNLNDQFYSWGEIFLGEQGARLALTDTDFSALSPKISPLPALDGAYAHQLDFQLHNFQPGDQFEFRYLFLPDSSYQSLRCQVDSHYLLNCQVIKQTASQSLPFLRVTQHGALNLQAGSHLSLILYQNQNFFFLKLWSSDQAEFARFLVKTTDLTPYQQKAALFAPALVLDQQLTTQKTAGLTLSHWQTTSADFTQTLALWPVYQTDPNWSQEILGHTAASGNPQTIGEIGCALTSSVMIFHHYHYHFLPDGQPLNPSTLNHWLTQQPDGYIDNNLLNWQALTRLSRQLQKQQLAQNPHSSIFPKLEFQVITGNPNDSYWQETFIFSKVQAGEPIIAELPGHFIVFHGHAYNLANFLVVDPYYPQIQTFLQEQTYHRFYIYGLRYLRPSQTDQSYIIVNVLGDRQLFINSAATSQFQVIALRQPVAAGENSQTVGRQYLLAKPPTGTYHFHFTSGSDTSQFSIFAYNQKGEVNPFPYDQSPISPEGESITLHFDSTSETDFAIFIDNLDHHQTWWTFNQSLSWPSQLLRLQFTYLVSHRLFATAEIYRRDYTDRGLLSPELSNQLFSFWQKQL